MIVLVAVSGLGLGLGLPGDALGGFGLGLVVGGSILLLFGSPRGYPDSAAVTSAFGRFRLDRARHRADPRSIVGVRRLTGSLDDESRIEVKAYGRDAMDSQVVNRLWRSVWYSEGGQTFSYNRLQAVEHEALALLMARRGGVAIPDVLAVGVGGR